MAFWLNFADFYAPILHNEQVSKRDSSEKYS
jgi:hypothetical protein